MAAFQYKFVGDGEKVFNGRLIKPGDLIDSEEELINGHFEPSNPIAKKAAAARDTAEKSAAAPAQASAGPAEGKE